VAWASIWIVVLAFAAVAVVVAIQSARFERRVEREARELWSIPAGAPARAPPESLPAPVRRYAEASGAARHAPVRTVRLRHGGTFRTAVDGPWLPIRGEQYFAGDPPGFVWWGRVRLAPGVWVEARDRSALGAGEMWIVAASTWTIGRVTGPELDQGALTRLLGEMVWLPTALLDDRYVRWEAVDDASARATLRVGGREVVATFRFGPDGLVTGFTAERYRDVGGEGVLTPFVGTSSDYREVGGLRLPFRMEAAWELDGRPAPYVRFEVDEIQLDPTEPF
jgi:hypothetical protein